VISCSESMALNCLILEWILVGYWMVCPVLHSNTGVCSLVVTILQTYERTEILAHPINSETAQVMVPHIIG